MSNILFDNNTLKNYTTNVIDTTLSKVTNPNLLYNADFRSPNSVVNQRTQLNYSNGYGYDGWFSSGMFNSIDYSVKALICQSQLNPTSLATLRQNIEFPERLYGKTITVSSDISSVNGTQTISATGTLPSTIPSSDFSIIAYHPDTNKFGVQVVFNTNGNISCMVFSTETSYFVYRVKLEVGNVSTLLNDPPQDYAEELRKCQRYYLPLITNPHGILGYGTAMSTTMVYLLYTIPVEMRITPATVIKSGTIYLGGSPVTDIKFYGNIERTNYLVVVMADTANFQIDTTQGIQCGDSNDFGYLALTAEL